MKKFFVLCGLMVVMLLCLSNSGLAQQESPVIRVMSFNIRLIASVDGENAWDHRKEVLAEEILERSPFLLGVQEATWPQMEYLAERLCDYSWIGVGRDDGQKGGEFSAVFYRKELFEVMDSGTFWLSQTPDEPGSLGWDATCRRVVSWGKFKMKSDSTRSFVFANTHFDHRGEKARQESAKLIRKKLTQIAGKLPCIVSGDFNCEKTSVPYKILTTAADGIPQWIDTNPVAKKRDMPVTRTYHDYGKIPGDQGKIIDFIFVSDSWKVLSYTICPEKRKGKFTSDHNPIIAELQF